MAYNLKKNILLK